MPSANEHRAAARQFRAMAELLANSGLDRRFVDSDEFGVAGPAATEIDARLQLATNGLLRSSDGYAALARECLRRADELDDVDHIDGLAWRLTRHTGPSTAP